MALSEDVEQKGTSPPPPLIHPGRTIEELQLVLHVKELEIRNKYLEQETVHL